MSGRRGPFGAWGCMGKGGGGDGGVVGDGGVMIYMIIFRYTYPAMLSIQFKTHTPTHTHPYTPSKPQDVTTHRGVRRDILPVVVHPAQKAQVQPGLHPPLVPLRGARSRKVEQGGLERVAARALVGEGIDGAVRCLFVGWWWCGVAGGRG